MHSNSKAEKRLNLKLHGGLKLFQIQIKGDSENFYISLLRKSENNEFELNEEAFSTK